MHIRKTLLPLLLCPFAALAVPQPDPVADLPNRVAPRSPDSTDGGLLSDLPDIVDSVKGLLNQQTMDQLETIIHGGATLLGGDTPKNLQKLLSGKNIDKLQDIVDNAHTLLTPQFTNQTSTLIDDATPVSRQERYARNSLANYHVAGGERFQTSRGAAIFIDVTSCMYGTGIRGMIIIHSIQ